MKETILALALAGALMLAGCGGGSKTATMSGGPAVGGGGGGGGGGTPTPTPTPTPMPITGLPDNHTLTSRTIPAGGTMVIGRGSWVYISCPAGGADCVITVAADGTATSTGGTPTIMRSEDPGPTDTPGTPLFGLPDGHTLSSRTIPAGATVVIGANSSLSCPSGGEACVIAVSDSGSARSTGGTPIVIVTIIITRPTPGVGTTPITWEQLPSLVNRMDHMVSVHKNSFPAPLQCRSLTDCQSVAKSLLAAATEPTGTRRRFQGTRRLQTARGVTFTERYWGGWLDNSIFIVENSSIRLDPETGDPIPSQSAREHIRFSMGIRDTNPVTGTYRGDAVDRNGYWGTSELTYTGGATGGQLDLTIDIPAWELMRWSNVPVDDSGGFDNRISYDIYAPIGPRKLKGSFYQGGEVGGHFTYKRVPPPDPGMGVNTYNHHIFGVFGAKRTP